MSFFFKTVYYSIVGFPGSSNSKEFTCNVGDLGSIPALGRSPEGEDMATHSSILAQGITMDRGAWQAIVHGVSKSRTQLSDFTFTFSFQYSYSECFFLVASCQHYLKNHKVIIAVNIFGGKRLCCPYFPKWFSCGLLLYIVGFPPSPWTLALTWFQSVLYFLREV